MSTTYYLSISGGADVLLVDSGGTILAYQEGSSEGPGGTTTYTVSPVFDTELINLPTDVQVWYSNDGTNFAYAPDWITGERSGDTITVEVTETTTVTAKLYYSNGTVVTDENGAEVASVSTVVLNPHTQLQNIRSFNQMELPTDEDFPAMATTQYEIMLSGYVYIDPFYGSGAGDLSNITISEASALTITDFENRIDVVVTGDSPTATTTRAQVPDSYDGYVAFDLEQPIGFVQGLVSHTLEADTTTANELISGYADLDAAGKIAYDQTVQTIGRALIAHSRKFPNAKLAVYGLGWCPSNSKRDSTSSNVGTYKLRREMYSAVLDYTEDGTTVASIIDLALVKQYANSAWRTFTYPLSFNPTYTGTNTSQNGIRESFRWMLPQVFANTTANTDHIKVAVLSSQVVENATPINDNVYTYMQANATWDNGLRPPATNDAPGKFTAMQYKQAQVSWADAGMDANRLLPPYIWGAPALDARTFYDQAALVAQDNQLITFGNLDDVLIIHDGDTGASTDPDV